MNNSTGGAEEVKERALAYQSGYWEKCGQWCLVRTPHDGGPKTVARWRCGSWNCEACTNRRAGAWFKRAMLGAEVDATRLRFVTLTFTHAKSPYATWEGIGACWNRLRTAWQRIDPSLEYIRTTEYHASGYPHLHLLVRSDYLAQPRLSAMAERAGFGPVCWITRPRSAHEGARYVCKYVLKACGQPMPKGFRRVTASSLWEAGKWHTRPRTPDPEASWELVRRAPEEVTRAILSGGGDVLVRDWWRLERDVDVDLAAMVY